MNAAAGSLVTSVPSTRSRASPRGRASLHVRAVAAPKMEGPTLHVKHQVCSVGVTAAPP